MIDARHIYRMVTRKIYDFSHEQLKNITSIVWLYRGETDKYLALIEEYFNTLVENLKSINPRINNYLKIFNDYEKSTNSLNQLEQEVKQAEIYIGKFISSVTDLKTNKGQIKVQKEFEKIADSLKNLRKNLEQSYKEGIEELNHTRNDKKQKAEIEEAHEKALEAVKLVAYFNKQIKWHLKRFPNARLADVPGLVKLTDTSEIEKNDYSLTPGRYVGVAPEEEDEDFDFEQTMQEIHSELAQLNKEAVKLAEIIQSNFEELGL